jgi:hypothetical protein
VKGEATRPQAGTTWLRHASSLANGDDMTSTWQREGTVLPKARHAKILHGKGIATTRHCKAPAWQSRTTDTAKTRHNNGNDTAQTQHIHVKDAVTTHQRHGHANGKYAQILTAKNKRNRTGSSRKYNRQNTATASTCTAQLRQTGGKHSQGLGTRAAQARQRHGNEQGQDGKTTATVAHILPGRSIRRLRKLVEGICRHMALGFTNTASIALRHVVPQA